MDVCGEIDRSHILQYKAKKRGKFHPRIDHMSPEVV
jgi:hypothetical protein